MASKSNSSSSTSSDVPQPMKGLNQMGPPPFLNKTYEIVDDSSTNHVVSWSKENNSFIVWDPLAFSVTLLPKYFKHNNFSSFVRQLNTYGFRKVDPDKWEFANEDFLRGKKYLLKNIKRRRASQSQASNQQVLDSACVEVGRFGLDGEIDQLKRDKQILMVELVKLRQQQQTTNTRLQLMEHRMKRTETKQRQLMGFLARAMQNPNFMQQLAQQKEMRKELEEAIRKKRRRPIEQVPSGHLVVEEGVENFGDLVKIEAEVHEFGDFEVPDQLDGLEMSIEGSLRGMDLLEARVESVEEMGNIVEDVDVDVDVGFWENLLNEHCVEEMGVLGSEVENEEEDVDLLDEQLGYCIGSSPK